jgi:membrane associated rhomboid family serine protease
VNSMYVPPLTPVVKRLIIMMCVVWFVVQILCDKVFRLNISGLFVLHPDQVIEKFWAWQLVTYMFFHALSPFHLIFNMMALWFIGAELERHWGARFFSIYFFVCGVGAAIIYCLGVAIYAAVTGVQTPLIIPVLGASGAIFGLMVAYGIVFSDRVIYFIIFPLKAKYFVLIAAAMDFTSLITSGLAGGEVAYLAHLGGALVGFLFLFMQARLKLMNAKAKIRKKSSGLRLVVDNEKLKNEDGPKYWN